jgi:hypothetical protein
MNDGVKKIQRYLVALKSKGRADHDVNMPMPTARKTRVVGGGGGGGRRWVAAVMMGGGERGNW